MESMPLQNPEFINVNEQQINLEELLLDYDRLSNEEKEEQRREGEEGTNLE